MARQVLGAEKAVLDRELGWMDRWLPAWLRPYGVLARWDRPIGAWLLLWPCWWGQALAPGWPSLGLAFLFLIGAFAMRGAGCTINDMTDRDLDAKVERTQKPSAGQRSAEDGAGLAVSRRPVVGGSVRVLVQLNYRRHCW